MVNYLTQESLTEIEATLCEVWGVGVSMSHLGRQKTEGHCVGT